MKPNGVTLKFQACLKDVSYMSLSGGGLSPARDEWKVYLIDKDGVIFSRFASDDSGRIYRWGVVRSNRTGRPAAEVATEFLAKISVTRTGVTVIEDNR